MVDLNEPAGWIVIPLKDINERLVRKGKSGQTCKRLAFSPDDCSGADFHVANSSAAKPPTRKGHTLETGKEQTCQFNEIKSELEQVKVICMNWIHQVKVHSPVENCVVSAAELSNYTTVGLKQFQSIRCPLWCQDERFTNELPCSLFMVNVLDLDTSIVLLFR